MRNKWPYDSTSPFRKATTFSEICVSWPSSPYLSLHRCRDLAYYNCTPPRWVPRANHRALVVSRCMRYVTGDPAVETFACPPPRHRKIARRYYLTVVALYSRRVFSEFKTTPVPLNHCALSKCDAPRSVVCGVLALMRPYG